MKKIFLSIFILSGVISVSFAQNATSSTTGTSAQNALQATPTVNATDVQKTEGQPGEAMNGCSSGTEKVCCMADRGSLEAAASTPAQLGGKAASCKTVMMGMSAENPEKNKKDDSGNK